MALVKVKPTSPGRRGMLKVVTPNLHKGAPYAPLLEKQIRGSGRNNNGHITIRHRGGGHKQHYRLIDFRRDKDGIPAKVERLEYDPNRSAHIALLYYIQALKRLFAQVTPYQYVTYLLVRRFIALKCCLVKALK